MKVVFSANQKRSGVFFSPAGNSPGTASVELNRFIDTEVSLRTGLWSLAGTLSVPVVEGKLPTV
ncbi:MAG TPA: hypothetical protein DDZ90_13960, partial [Planctomycetaceae bacterium]|nr:hypothetical protein [Planctomycetaceae bacterium]